MIKVPYAISNFADIPTGGYFYADRTRYIGVLEELSGQYQVFLRPRRFGKSLFVRMLHCYYGIEHKEKFEQYFGKYHIGQHPTPLANRFLVLALEFSRIDTQTPETTYRDFLRNVVQSVKRFISAYPDFFTEEEWEEADKLQDPSAALIWIFNKAQHRAPDKKLLVLIDEYDHFANELLAFNFSHFLEIVGQNGWVRKFYETLKEATQQGIIGRMFITGVSPITLDSLTSGFNIAYNYTTEPSLNGMMGFVEEEVRELLLGVGIPAQRLEESMSDIRFWYDGYLFHPKGKRRVYNPNMVIYFASHYRDAGDFPDKILDDNIASDYTKVRNMFRLDGREDENLSVLNEVLENHSVTASLITRYDFAQDWTESHFVSLLFYLGVLTVEKRIGSRIVFRIPNFVINQLYFQYFYQVTLKRAQMSGRKVNAEDVVDRLSFHNDIQPLLDLTNNVLSNFNVEDRKYFNENHIKAIFFSFFYQVGYFNIYSELDVRKSLTQKGRLDLLLTCRQPFETKYQFAFELKFVGKDKSQSVKAAHAEARDQLAAYLQYDDMLKGVDNLKGYTVVFKEQVCSVEAL